MTTKSHGWKLVKKSKFRGFLWRHHPNSDVINLKLGTLSSFIKVYNWWKFQGQSISGSWDLRGGEENPLDKNKLLFFLFMYIFIIASCPKDILVGLAWLGCLHITLLWVFKIYVKIAAYYPHIVNGLTKIYSLEKSQKNFWTNLNLRPNVFLWRSHKH